MAAKEALRASHEASRGVQGKAAASRRMVGVQMHCHLMVADVTERALGHPRMPASD